MVDHGLHQKSLDLFRPEMSGRATPTIVNNADGGSRSSVVAPLGALLAGAKVELHALGDHGPRLQRHVSLIRVTLHAPKKQSWFKQLLAR